MASYAFSTDIDVHLRDIDRLHHVNNAVLVSYIEQARIEYLDELVGYLDREPNIVVAAHEMAFERPVSWGETARIDLRVTDVGRSSFEVDYRVRVGDQQCATAETAVVTFDSQSQEPVPMPDEWREALLEDNRRFLGSE